ncbi:MAG: phosphopantetheine-binding protein [Akkermansia sp.]|nr:phosphopantetheine-binding protein [Akkermansia sp.]
MKANKIYNEDLFGTPETNLATQKPKKKNKTRGDTPQDIQAGKRFDIFLESASPIKVYTVIALMNTIPDLEPEKASDMALRAPIITHQDIPENEVQHIISEFSKIGAVASYRVHEKSKTAIPSEQEQQNNLNQTIKRIIQQLKDIMYEWDSSSIDVLTPILTLPFNTNKMLQQAAANGDSGATFVLGMQYFWGISKKKDEEKAVELFYNSAIAGLADAQNTLGLCYATGSGIPEDAKQAAIWYRKAAEQGDRYAMLNLGVCYTLGNGTRQDALQAQKWLERALAHGCTLAHGMLGIFYKIFGSEEDIPLAIKHLKQAVSLNSAIAMSELADCYMQGIGVAQDTEEALRLLNKSAQMGNADAFFALGEYYECEAETASDFNTAIYWYTKAEEMGLTEEAAEAIERCRSKNEQQSFTPPPIPETPYISQPFSTLPPIPGQCPPPPSVSALPPIPLQGINASPYSTTTHAYTSQGETYPQIGSKELREIIISCISEILGIDPGSISPNARLVQDLGADELDIIEIWMTLESSIGVNFPDNIHQGVYTVKDCYQRIKAHLQL